MNAKRVILFLTLLSLMVTSAQAQYVTIPDPVFRNFLLTYYSGCMSGSQLDTNCAAATPIDLNTGSAGFSYLTNVHGIQDLTGIQYFSALKILSYYDATLTYIPAFPKNLEAIDLYQSNVTALPPFPATVKQISCVTFPSLVSLPAFPAALNYLTISETPLTTLPALPAGLPQLNCSKNQLTSLPALPASLLSLDCSDNQLTSLPTLPVGLWSLLCSNNPLTSLPSIPDLVSALRCSHTQLTGLPSLINTRIDYIDCSYGALTALPALPSTLRQLDCSHNQLTSIQSYPAELAVLNCSYNQLTSLASMYGSKVTGLNCSNNALTTLPPLAKELFQLDCRNNQLDCLPYLGRSMYELRAAGNNITCLPNIPMRRDSTGHYNVDIPEVVCGVDNVNACAVYPTITGKAFVDANNNGTQDTGETGYASATIEVQPGNYFVTTDSTGLYVVSLESIGTFQVSIHLPQYAYYTINPSTHNVTLTESAISSNHHFPMNPIVTVNDLEVYIAAQTVARPGREVCYVVTYRNVGTTVLDGSVYLTYDNLLYLEQTLPAYVAQSNQTLHWNFVSLSPGESKRIACYFRLPTTATLGTPIPLTAEVTSAVADYTPANNHVFLEQTVVTSFDPNDKTVSPASDLTLQQLADEDPLTYTVRFQNTGNDTAFVVVIRDTLSAKVEIEDIVTLSASHAYRFQMHNGAAAWTFDNILLPDSTTNERRSHGFIQYKVIPKHTLQPGDEIENTAHIFFDFNEPVATNTTLNTVASPTGIENGTTELFQVYPNPNKGLFTLAAKGKGSLRITGTDGRQVHYQEALDFTDPVHIDLQEVKKGIYIIQAVTDQGTMTQKMVLN